MKGLAGRALAVLGMGAAAYTAVALATYTPTDYASYAVPLPADPGNAGGVTGAWLAGAMTAWLGTLGAWALVVGGWLWCMLAVSGARRAGLKMAGLVLAAVGVAALEGLSLEVEAFPGRASGGIFGQAMASGGVVLIGPAGSWMAGILAAAGGSALVLERWLQKLGLLLLGLLILVAKAVVTAAGRMADFAVWLVRAPRGRRGRRSAGRAAAADEPPVSYGAADEDVPPADEDAGQDEDAAADDDAADSPLDLEPGEEVVDEYEELVYEDEDGAEDEAEAASAGTAAVPPSTGRGDLSQVKVRNAAPPPKPSRARSAPQKKGAFNLPSWDLLEYPVIIDREVDENLVKEKAAILEQTLSDFRIDGRVTAINRGPVVTMFEVKLGPGIKVSHVTGLADNLAMNLKAPSIRVFGPIPGKSVMGVEVPNAEQETVRLRELLEAKPPEKTKHRLPIYLGKDNLGQALVSDLARMPHLLIAGATGSGKSVCINSLLLSVLLTRTPEECRLILVDPKMVELQPYEGLPHLLCPVVTDMKKVPATLEWAVEKMEERYELLSKVGVRDIIKYNSLGAKEVADRLVKRGLSPEEAPEGSLPYIVVVVDELADLMMVASKEVEASIMRLAQKSRAVGIHVVLATQRPSVDVITGTIKSNLNARISFRVTSKVDSRTILDGMGAETLVGNGDLLYRPPGTQNLVRAQGAYVSDEEVQHVVEYLKDGREPEYDDDLLNLKPIGSGKGSDSGSGPGAADDELFERAVDIIMADGRASTTYVQRRLGVGFNRASNLMEIMENEGIVGAHKGAGQMREILIGFEQWEARKQARR